MKMRHILVIVQSVDGVTRSVLKTPVIPPSFVLPTMGHPPSAGLQALAAFSGLIAFGALILRLSSALTTRKEGWTARRDIQSRTRKHNQFHG